MRLSSYVRKSRAVSSIKSADCRLTSVSYLSDRESTFGLFGFHLGFTTTFYKMMDPAPSFLNHPGYEQFDWKDENHPKPKMMAAHVILYSRVDKNVFDFDSRLKANVMVKQKNSTF